MNKQSLCKLGFHKWPKGIKTVNDWIDSPYGDGQLEFITEDLNNKDEMYFIATCLKCKKRELRRYPHPKFMIKFLNLWKIADFFTFIRLKTYKLEESFTGDFNSILESEYRFIFLNFEIDIITKPIESQPGNIFDLELDEIPESESLEIYKKQTGHYPDSCE